MERKILDIKVSDRIQNAQVRRSGLDAAIRVPRLKWQWEGYIARMKQDRWVYTTGAQWWHIVSMVGDVTSPTTTVHYV